jgi:hypothetical protein
VGCGDDPSVVDQHAAAQMADETHPRVQQLQRHLPNKIKVLSKTLTFKRKLYIFFSHKNGSKNILDERGDILSFYVDKLTHSWQKN